jgi:cytochrome c oxidase cbb3-type subunit 3
MSEPTDQVLGHADEADGIEEYDNPLPDWWLGLFYLTLLWGVAYWTDITFFKPEGQADWYDAEVAMAEKTWPSLLASAKIDDSPETLALGADLFGTNCASCHGGELQGGIGPNLADAEWIHGGGFDEVVHTITEGVGAKGMPKWGPILGPKKISAVASFILSKSGSAPAAAPKTETPETTEAPAVATLPPEPADAVPAGASVFQTNCVACHGADMKGGIGPNLLDTEWIHGDELADIKRTITDGVPDKGMISWKGVLSDDQIEAVATFVFQESHHQ